MMSGMRAPPQESAPNGEPQTHPSARFQGDPDGTATDLKYPDYTRVSPPELDGRSLSQEIIDAWGRMNW